MAVFLLEPDVFLDQVKRHMPGAFDDYLDPGGPGPGGQLPQDLEFLELGLIIGVGQTTGPQAVSQAQGDVVGAGDVQKLIKMFVQGIFLLKTAHPGHQKGPAPGDDAGDPLL